MPLQDVDEWHDVYYWSRVRVSLSRLCKVEKVSSILNLLSKTKEGKKQNMIMLNSKVPIN